MRSMWIGLLAALGCLTVPGAGRAQATEASDASGTHVDVGLRVSGFIGLTRTGWRQLYGYEEPLWGRGELRPGGSIGAVLTVEVAALPVAFRATADWAFSAGLHVETSSRGAPAGGGPENRDGSLSRAVADVLWYAAPSDSRWRPFIAGGVGVTWTRFESRRVVDPFLRCVVPEGCPGDPFAGESIDPAVHGAAGVDLRLGRVRLSAEAGVYGSPIDFDGGPPASGWNTATFLSLAVRRRVR